MIPSFDKQGYIGIYASVIQVCCYVIIVILTNKLLEYGMIQVICARDGYLIYLV